MDYLVWFEFLAEQQHRSECILIGSAPMTATNRHDSTVVLSDVHNGE
jgi:hypothetical protein